MLRFDPPRRPDGLLLFSADFSPVFQPVERAGLSVPDDSLTTNPAPASRRALPLCIGEFSVRPASNEIVGPAGLRRLRPRLMLVLLRLAAEPGAVVPRQTLLDDVWPRREVADEVLSRTIAELRTALGDDARESRYIETIPKVGYRLIADVAPVAPVAPAAAFGTVTVMPAAAPGSDAGTPVALEGMTRRRTARYAMAAVAVVAALVYIGTRPGGDAGTRLERQLANAVPFSSDPDLDLAPRFSADGAQVAFASGTSERARIVLQEVATGARRTIGDDDAFRTSPVFFPDGQRIAYYRRASGDCAIVERMLATGNERVLVDCAREPFTRFDLAPDGRTLVYGTREGLRVHTLATGASTPLTLPGPGDVADLQPRFSPDGAEVAFFRSYGGSGRDIWRVSVDDPASARAVGSPSGLSYGLAWLGARGPLIAAVDWSGFRALNAFDLDTRKATLLGARGAQFPDVDAAGNVVYENASYQANLHWVDAATPTPSPQGLWPSTRYSSSPAIAPDGHRVAFVSNRDGVASLFVGTLGGDARRVPLPANLIYQRPAWSPDGRALYAVQDTFAGKGPSRAARIDADTGALEILDGLGDAVAGIYPSADDAMLYAAVVDGSVTRLVRAPRADPSARTWLPLPPVASFRVRGDRLVYTTERAAGMVACALPALTCAPIDGLGQLFDVDDWTLADGAVWYSAGTSKPVLRRYDFTQRRVTAELAFAPTALGPSVAATADGRQVVVARQEPPAIDLMLARRAAR